MTISESAVRVGLIGYGFSGKTFHAPLIAAAPGLALRAVASRDPEKVHADFPAAAVHKTPVTLATSPDIDLVVIASPNPSHAPLARLALDAGKHVVVDKPFTLDLASARDLVALADAKDLILSVFHNRRWDSDFLTIRRALAQGLAGAVSQFEAHFDRFRPQVRDRWREDGSPGGGLWFDLGPHLIDQALQLFGLPDRVQANFAHQRAGARAEDWAHVVLDYGQRRAVLHAAMLVAGRTSRFVVHGEAGSLEKRHGDPQEVQLIGGLRPGDAGWGHDPDPLIVYGPNHERRTIAATPGDQSRYYTSLVDALNGRTSDAVTSIQALAVMSILEAAIESARLRRSVDLPLTAEERRRFEATAV